MNILVYILSVLIGTFSLSYFLYLEDDYCTDNYIQANHFFAALAASLVPFLGTIIALVMTPIALFRCRTLRKIRIFQVK